jgi:quercetin dioxygenase-like cupin family protein
MRTFLIRTLIVILFAAAAVALVYAAVLPQVLVRPALLVIESGTALVNGTARDAGESVELAPGSHVEIGTTDGLARLDLPDAALDLAPGARVALVTQFWRPLDGWRVTLELQGGLVRGLRGTGDELVHLILIAPGGTALVPSPGAEFVAEGADSGLRVTVSAGTLQVTREGEAQVIGPGEARIIPPDGGALITDSQPHGAIRVVLYGADGGVVSLPVTLTEAQSGQTFHFPASWTMPVPARTYTLQVALIEPYILPDLTVEPNTTLDIPVTLGEVVFDVRDEAGRAVRGGALIVRGRDPAAEQRLLPGEPLLISPGAWDLIVSRDVNREAVQQTQVSLVPGQRLTVTLRADQFR